MSSLFKNQFKHRKSVLRDISCAGEDEAVLKVLRYLKMIEGIDL